MAIFAKSVNSYDRKNLCWCALILCLIMEIIPSTLNPSLHPFSAIGAFVNLQLSGNVVYDLLVSTNQTTDVNSNPTVGNVSTDLHSSINDTTLISEPSATNKTLEPLCTILHNRTDYCDIEGDIRIQASSSTIFVVTDHQHENAPNSTNSWIMQPYARRGMPNVKKWTVKSIQHKDDVNGEQIPKCTQNHSFPAILFSTTGLSATNYFHGWADILFPLYSTSYRFRKDVQFLVSNWNPEWIAKQGGVAIRLTRSELVNIDIETTQVHCYKKLIAGLNFYMELIMDPSDSGYPTAPSMKIFRHIVQQTYGLKREKCRQNKRTSPSDDNIEEKNTCLDKRGRSVAMATKVGFKVVVSHEESPTNFSRFAQEVNSCDVLLGVHGAGITNMLFLPDRALVIQIVPLGIDPYPALLYNWPLGRMNLSYLQYKISTNESSLIRQYPLDHPIFRDTIFNHSKEWDSFFPLYLIYQNVTVDIERFRGTLVEALKILEH